MKLVRPTYAASEAGEGICAGGRMLGLRKRGGSVDVKMKAFDVVEDVTPERAAVRFWLIVTLSF